MIRFIHSTKSGLLVLSLLGIVGIFMFPSKSYALSLNPNPSIPGHVRSDLESCDSSGKSPGYAPWVSPEENQATTSVSVAYGTEVVPLAYHIGGVVCYSNSNVRVANTQVVRAGLSGVSGASLNLGMIENHHLTNDWGGSFQSVGRYTQSSKGFNLNLPTNLAPGSYNFVISIYGKTINRFSDLVHKCVGGDEPVVGGLTSFEPCTEHGAHMIVRVVIEEPALQISVVAHCNALRVRAITPPGANYNGRFHARLFVNDREITNNDHGAAFNVQSGLGSGQGAVFNLTPYRSFSPQRFKVRVRALLADGTASSYSKMSINYAPYDGYVVSGGRACASIEEENINCDSLGLRVGLVGGGSYATRLIVDDEEIISGSSTSPPGFATAASGSGVSHDITSYRDMFSRKVQSRARPIGSAYASRSTIQEYFGSGSDLYRNYSAEYGTKRTSSNGVGPCAEISCQGINVEPLTPQPNQEFTITMRMNIEGLGTNHKSFRYRMVYRTSSSETPTTTPVGGEVYEAGTGNGIITISHTTSRSEASNLQLRYRMQYTQSSVFLAGNYLNFPVGEDNYCGGEVVIGTLPYHKVYGGDVLAGMAATGPDGACNINESAKVEGRNNGSSDSYTGAGAQLAVFALGEITGFASAQFRNVPKGLSFANLPEAVDYGGNLEQAALSCGPNYWSTAQNVLSGNQTIGARTLNAGQAGQAGQQQNIYVDGDVYISGDINYANVDYGNIDSIPQFRLIVKGNIYVAPSVNQLSGLYVAMKSSPSSNDGKFYTCGKQYAAADSGMLVNDCNNKLTVYGAVVADQIKFSRTPGTVGNATTNENYQAGGDPAEVFIYTPELWLRSGSGGRGGAASFSTLPPVL